MKNKEWLEKEIDRISSLPKEDNGCYTLGYLTALEVVIGKYE